MTSESATTVAVINRGYGTIEVHSPTCGDLTRDAAGASVWNVEATSFKDVVLDVYPPANFDYDEADWESYAGDVRIMPCTPSLDGRKTKRNAQWAHQLRKIKRNEREQYPVFVTME